MNFLEINLNLFFLYFVRLSVIFGSVRILRGIIGFSGVVVLASSIALFCNSGHHDQILNHQIVDNFYYYVFSQIVIGVVFGVLLSLVLEIIPYTGRLIDIFRGNQFAEQFAPEIGSRESQLEMYGGLFVICLFFKEDYLFRTLEIFSSYNVSELDLFAILEKVKERNLIFQICKDFFELSFLIVFPFVLVTFSLEIALSFLQKLNSRFQSGAELSLLKSGLGVLFLFFVVLMNDEVSFKLWDFSSQIFRTFRGSNVH